MKHLSRWPLLIVGLAVLTYGVLDLRDPSDPSDARAFVLAVGSLVLGAGLVLVVLDRPDPHEPKDEADPDE